jgi:hypothetical protein
MLLGTADTKHAQIARGQAQASQPFPADLLERRMRMDEKPVVEALQVPH